ncbi:type I inositol polyphosphate 5-phosphatase 8-like [Hordeum vulgare subsp. vulgare]|uniref:Inositol polyphosphate-related phosphatase domain-containing protein n=1 Tax=Hordeum vulgare subsp. vulgare TaxID=112509 RepID=A0A8I6WQ00_HORVV|nr:type I inositol polyphosphate 5-phosphatase 8-like [Hordeum vulgare subsp. vulgare]
MTTDNARIPKSSSWPRRTRTAVRRWLSLKSNAEPSFHSDCTGDRSGVGRGGQEQGRRKSCSDRDRDGSRRGPSGAAAAAAAGWLVEEGRENLMPPHPRYGRSSSWRPPKELRVLVGTWNVGGRSPHQGLDLSGWLLDQHDQHASSSPHIYVLGFQEIVPLNAGNVLGSEDRGPASKWLGLIGEALNPSSLDERNDCHRSYRCATVEDANPESGHKAKATFLEIPVMDDTVSEPEEEDEDEDSEPSTSNPESSSEEETGEFATMMRERARHGYRLAASKQMVGIFLCVWVQADVMPRVTSLRVSCVGRGIMGYMGNKGSISISLTLQGGSEAAASTSLCFVCTHLASGEKDGDEVRRNCDVAEILKRTRFPRPHRFSRLPSSPETILDHDKVIWLGDLNYRLSSTGGGGGGGGDGETRGLLERNEWRALLERDQLRAEQRAGRVFGGGWEEGEIRFPPTYKYLAESDTYAMAALTSSSAAAGRPSREKKKRTPAWCDRILWRGEGMEQAWYERGESRFSDHRPVNSLFSIRLRHHHADDHGSSMQQATANKACCRQPRSGSAVIEAEEMLVAPPRHCRCLQSSRF